jgi:membrane protein DedA with SNARE-associated domain
MSLEEMICGLAHSVRDHQAWAAPLVFVLAFAESLAFLSLIIPAWGALVTIGAVIGVSSIEFLPIWIAAALGAAFGDWISYWLGSKFKGRIAHMWPLSRYPQMLPRAELFMKRWGIPGIFLGRFTGPLRATVPIVAGVAEMPYLQFQLANFTSAFLWAAVLLAPGMFGLKMLITPCGG